jgi:hypothetical protein
MAAQRVLKSEKNFGNRMDRPLTTSGDVYYSSLLALRSERGCFVDDGVVVIEALEGVVVWRVV